MLKGTFSLRYIQLWNCLPDNVTSLNSLKALKSSLHGIFGDILYDFVESFSWDEECQATFDSLKKALVKALVLLYL